MIYNKYITHFMMTMNRLHNSKIEQFFFSLLFLKQFHNFEYNIHFPLSFRNSSIIYDKTKQKKYCFYLSYWWKRPVSWRTNFIIYLFFLFSVLIKFEVIIRTKNSQHFIFKCTWSPIHLKKEKKLWHCSLW